MEVLLRRSWLEYWAPHVSGKSVDRFHAEDPVGRYLDGCLYDIDVAVSGGGVVGMAHREGDMLHAIHIATAAQCSGVGSRLMCYVEERGARRLEVRSFNRRAYEFYVKRGWRENRRYPHSEMGTPVETIEMVREGRETPGAERA